MATPKLTIIIPTRERCDTLEHALRTCVTQDYDKLEILVSDNCSEDATREVVSSFKDPRIRYLNTGRRVSMSHNWEFALSQVSEGYVTILGDDDGFLPGAISEIAGVIENLGHRLLAWKWAIYAWPHYPNAVLSDALVVPLATGLGTLRSKDSIKKVLDAQADYHILPSLYNAFVDINLINQARGPDGRFFRSRTPDVYASIAIAGLVPEYPFSHRPYTVAGASQHSAGTAYLSSGTSERRAAEKIDAEENLPFHESLVFAPSGALVVAEAFLQAREVVPALNEHHCDLKLIMKAMLNDARYQPQERYRLIEDAVLAIGRLNDMESQARLIVQGSINTPKPVMAPMLGYHPIRKHFHVNCKAFAITDVYTASLLCGHILALHANGRLSLYGLDTVRVVLRSILIKIKRPGPL